MIHLAAVLALVMAAALDKGHVHAAGPDVPPCYVCQLSSDLGAAPAALSPDTIARAVRAPAQPSAAAPRAAAHNPYYARGPPLSR